MNDDRWGALYWTCAATVLVITFLLCIASLVSPP